MSMATGSSDPLWSAPSYFRQTRKGKILHSVTELYLRDDLGLGFTIPTHVCIKHNNVAVTTNGTAQKISSADDLLSLLVRPRYDVKMEGASNDSSVKNNSRRGMEKKIRLVIADTNVLLHNLDLFENSSFAISNIVIPQTALLECRSRSFAAYGRIMDLFQSSSTTVDTTTGTREKNNRRCLIFFPDKHHVKTQCSSDDDSSVTVNDHNDAMIRSVALLYGKELNGSGVEVVLLTDDNKSRELAITEQQKYFNDIDDDEDRTHDSKRTLLYQPKSVRQHVADLEREEPSLSLSDLVAQFSSFSSIHKSESSHIYPPHVSQSDLSVGIKSGRYFQGVIRAERGCYDRCYVSVKKGNDRIAISIVGNKDVNRAIDGDVVAVEIHPIHLWDSYHDFGTDESKTRYLVDNIVGIPSETAEPSLRDEENVADAMEVPAESVLDSKSGHSHVLKRPSGKVVGIIRRNFRQNYCGSIYSVHSVDKAMKKDVSLIKDLSNLQNNVHYRTERDRIAEEYEFEHADGSFTCVFFGCDGRVPPILIRTTRRSNIIGQRLLVAIDSWPSDSRFPLGHYVQTVGFAGEKDVETEVLLHEHKIPCDPFPAKVLACLPPDDYEIKLESGRLDLRHLPIMSIDPPGCKDIDDALHCILLPNKNYQIGVHIADVTHYLKAGSAMDLEAANRSTSTYLVNKRIDMLPGLLTTDLCSLRENVDRFAFSVIWEVSPCGDILHVDFQKTLIHSIAALTYQQAQALIDHPSENDEDIKVSAVKRLASLARIFRSKRIAAGALTLASQEVKFVLDSESLNPTDVQSYQMYESNALVEEFMLLANVTVSKRILRSFPAHSVLRRHPSPNRAMFDTLISKAKCRGVTLNIDDSKKLADSLDAAVLETDPYFNNLLRILSTRCMSPAQYFCSGEYKPSDWHHYGLAAPVYTHFTSPIRRYADVVVHRLLAAAIGVDSLPAHLSSKSYLHDLTANMNRRHRAAQLAGRASVQLHTLMVFSGEQNDKEEDAYVLDVDCKKNSEPSITVIVPRYGIEGRVRLKSIKADDENFVREPDQHRVYYKDGESGDIIASIQVFEKVMVKIRVELIQENEKELVLDLIKPSFHPLVTLEKKRRLEVAAQKTVTTDTKKIKV